MSPKHLQEMLTELDMFYSEQDKPNFEAVTISEENTLEEAMSIMVNNKVQRLYVADSEMKPLRVITTTDLLRVFFV